jgi:hypothetical protein
MAGALALGMVLNGCVVSLAPVIPESGARFDPRLIGTWDEGGGSDRVVVSQAGGNTYAIEYSSDGKLGKFLARLGSLGERTVLDLWPAPADTELPQPYAGLLIPDHVLVDLNVGADEITAAALEPESLLASLQAGQVRLTHSRSGDQLVLHGTTEELRAVLGPYVRRPGVLGQPDAWRRSTQAGPAAPVAVPCFEVSSWPEADQLFRRDPQWSGGDAASSVDLGAGRILWLFGDSWIDPSGRGTRQGARMVSNSVAIQTGTDPETASIRFYSGRGADGAPAGFVPNDGDERYWFGNGVRVGDRLVLFVNRIRSTTTGLGFESVGWAAWMVDNPDAEPSAWRMRRLATLTNPLGVVLGFAGVLRLGEYVYAFGSEDPVKSHPIYAARWSVEQIHEGSLMHPEWWAGDTLGWVPDSSAAPRWPLFENGQSELSIHVDRGTRRFLVVQTRGFGPADVMMRAAPTLTGPWSEPQLVYRPPEYYRPNVMIYSAKAHPELTGGDLVLTYSTNTFQFAEQLSDSLIYYPRFVRLTKCR